MNPSPEPVLQQQPVPLAGNSLFAPFVPLLLLMLAVFAGYFAMGMALPVVPRHVHDTLGQGTFMLGGVMRAGRRWRCLRGWSVPVV